MKHPYFDLDLIRLSAQDGATTLDKQFLVIDNFDETQDTDNKDFFVNYPVKISFTIAIFCVSGEIAFGDNYFKGTTLIEETTLLEQRLHASPLCHLTDNAMQECLVIYRLAKSKIAEADNPFRRGALRTTWACRLRNTEIQVLPFFHFPDNYYFCSIK